MDTTTVKIRAFPEHNYRAIYFNGKTLRQTFDPTKPITELEYPEFYDIKVTGKCKGNCPYCYQNATEDQFHYDVLDNIDRFFKGMSLNEKPFQAALGGGEPTLHPDFYQILSKFYELGITPNYTTNGMFVKEKNCNEILKATKKYCGGVAVSCHPHLKKYWKEAIELFYKNKIVLNLHLIISDKKSVKTFLKIFKKYNQKIDYFVLLPYTEKGRAVYKAIEWRYLFAKVKKLSTDKIAFGANFYPHLKEDNFGLDVSIYEPEILSKYLDMKDMKIYKSSFA